MRYLLLFLLFLSGCSSPVPELHVYSWGDFLSPSVVERFEEEFHCKVVLDTYDSNEAMYAKLKAGASGYDIIFPSGYILEIMEDQQMVKALDSEKLPNLRYLDLEYLALVNAADYESGVPYAITFSGIAYRKDKTTAIPSSWAVFSDGRLRGRMTMLNDVREALGAALKFRGFSLNTTSKTEIDAAVEQLLEWKKNLAKFESEQYKNGIASAEYLVVQGYSGDVMQIMKEDPDVGFLLPQEGSIFSCDYAAIPQDAPASDLAHAFINFLLKPDMAAANMEFTYYRSPNTEAYTFLDRTLLENPALFPPKEFLDKSEIILNLGDYIILYNRAWDYIKAH